MHNLLVVRRTLVGALVGLGVMSSSVAFAQSTSAASPLDGYTPVTACAALVIDYAHHRDNFNADAFADLFAEDGVLIIGENRWEGRDAIRARIEALDSRTTIRHHMSSIRINPVDADHATGVSYAVIYSAPSGRVEITGPALIGDYIDRYVRTENGWKIAHRELKTTFSQR